MTLAILILAFLAVTFASSFIAYKIGKRNGIPIGYLCGAKRTERAIVKKIDRLQLPKAIKGWLVKRLLDKKE
jgi:hypothetical protein